MAELRVVTLLTPFIFLGIDTQEIFAFSTDEGGIGIGDGLGVGDGVGLGLGFGDEVGVGVGTGEGEVVCRVVTK